MGRDIRIIPDTGPESVIDFFRALYIEYVHLLIPFLFVLFII